MCLNHPETISCPTPHPQPVRGKIVFHETGPQCQKGWGPLALGTFTVLCNRGHHPPPELSHLPKLKPCTH